jgi:hypothetical protein
MLGPVEDGQLGRSQHYPGPGGRSAGTHCCGLSFSRDTEPLDRSASVPPSCQALCHRRTDPSVIRKSCAISLIVSPRANRPAACSRSRSRCCSSARSQPTSRPKLHEFK